MAEPPPSMQSMLRHLTLTESPSGETTSNTSSGAETGYATVTGGMEGYDYEFVNAPEERYKCAICLLVLREPCQTPCGHLYCRMCIMKWLRGSHNRCPVDNVEISQQSLFPDNFSKREIDNFSVFCPNTKQGCDVITTVKHMPDHLGSCPLALVPCPNQCSHVLLRRDVEEHVRHTCDRRQVACADCGLNFLAIDLKGHRDVCPSVRIQCQYCQEEVTRQEIGNHEERICPEKVICCTFYHLGCGTQMPRKELQNHLKESLTHHLNLLCYGVMVIFRHLNLPPIITSGQPAPNTEMTQTETEMMQAMAGVLSSLRPSLNVPVPEGPPSFPFFTPPTSLRTPSPSTALHPRCPFPAQPYPYHHPHPTSDQTPRSTAPPPTAQGTTSDEAQEASLMSYRSDPSQPDYSPVSVAGLSGSGWGESSSSGGGAGKSLAATGSVGSGGGSWGSWQEEKLVLYTQKLVELQGQLETMDRSLKGKIKQHDQQLSELEGRICQGQFFWKIHHYSRYQQEAERGDTPVLHSPPFYSSASGGYKLCVRVNLNGVDSARGRHLSLFVHFMQGEHDEVLDWPFRGRIVLSVLDQNEVCERRRHVEETLVAQPNLAAFQRPTTPRNHKGFGYMEFLPLAALKNSSSSSWSTSSRFVKDDTLIVKVQVLLGC